MRRETMLSETMEQSLVSEESFQLEGQFLHTWEGRVFLSCLDELPEQQRESILLAYYQGFTHQEIARHMKAPLGTVKSWIRRGLETLRTHFDMHRNGIEQLCAVSKEKASEKRRESQKRRILVVDDDESSRKVLNMLLEGEGYRVQTAQNSSTLDLFDPAPFDMLFVDVRIPHLNGLEMAKTIRKTDASVPIILVTARPHLLDGETVTNKVIDHILPKPVTREQLRTCVQQCGRS